IPSSNRSAAVQYLHRHTRGNRAAGSVVPFPDQSSALQSPPMRPIRGNRFPAWPRLLQRNSSAEGRRRLPVVLQNGDDCQKRHPSVLLSLEKRCRSQTHRPTKPVHPLLLVLPPQHTLLRISQVLYESVGPLYWCVYLPTLIDH